MRANTEVTDTPALLAALAGRGATHTPVWFPQIGDLTEYDSVRAGKIGLQAVLDPRIAAELTWRPALDLGLDGAPVYCNAAAELVLAGMPEDYFTGGEMPAVRDGADVDTVTELEFDDPLLLTRIVATAAHELPANIPVIGWVASPATLAALLLEARTTDTATPGNLHLTRSFMLNHPDLWRKLLNWCTDVSAACVRAQIRGGARVLFLYDGTAGAFTWSDYQDYSRPYSSLILDGAHAFGVPTVHYGAAAGHLLGLLRDAGADAIAPDYRIRLWDAIRQVRHGASDLVTVQGNIDSARLTGPWQDLKAHLNQILDDGSRAFSLVMSTGGAVPADTDPEILYRIVEYVHANSLQVADA